jgi:hypothetical protein
LHTSVKTLKEDEVAGACSTHRDDEKCTKRSAGREHLGEQDVVGKIILKQILEKLDVRLCAVLKWLRTATSGVDGWGGGALRK